MNKTKVIIENPYSRTTIVVGEPIEELKKWFYGGSITNQIPQVLRYETMVTTDKEILRDGYITISAWNCAFVSLSEISA